MDTAVAAKPLLVSVTLCCCGALASLMLAGTAAGVVRSAQGGEQTYAGIGATVAAFRAAHATTSGSPPAGATYYRIDRIRNGRVVNYHVVVGWKAGRSTSAILARLTGRELPSDAKLVVPYNGFSLFIAAAGWAVSLVYPSSRCPPRHTPGGMAYGRDEGPIREEAVRGRRISWDGMAIPSQIGTSAQPRVHGTTIREARRSSRDTGFGCLLYGGRARGALKL